MIEIFVPNKKQNAKERGKKELEMEDIYFLEKTTT
jgi:hypothetical protein